MDDHAPFSLSLLGEGLGKLSKRFPTVICTGYFWYFSRVFR
jgi:hypothetical protein